MIAANRLAVATLAAVLGLGLYATPSHAAADRSGAKQRESVPTMVVLDASGSMNTADAPGPRIAAAKRAVTQLVDDLPAGARLGLEVYGTSTGSSNAEKAAGCRDIKTVVPVGPVDRTSFTTQVNGIRASGYTPIAASLRRAAAALPSSGPRSIVLVSDGQDTCAPPQPCAVARELHESGLDLTVHTVGFKVNAKARGQLQCIAAATGGRFQDAGDGDSLSRSLRVQVSRALRGYAIAGTPIEGSDNAGDGPVVAPGQYVDTVDAVDPSSHNSTKYYTVDSPSRTTPYFSATVVPPARRLTDGGTLSVSVTITRADDSLCTATGYNDDIGLSGTVSATTALATPTSPTERACLARGPFVIKVTRSGTAFGTEAIPVELSYRAEPPANSDGLPGPAAEQPEAPVRAYGSSTPVRSGTSYNDAPRVSSGVYRDSFVSGEQRYVKVHLGWGQRLAFSLTPTTLPGLGILDGVAGQVAVANPVRERVDLVASAYTTGPFLGSTDEQLRGSTRAPVRYRNRESTVSGIDGYSLDGDYYLVLSTKFTTEGEAPLNVPYTLRISVSGSREHGPDYSGSTASDDRSSGPSSGSRTSEGPVRLNGFTVADSDEGTSAAPAVVGVGGGAVLIAIGALVWWRRRATGTGPTLDW